MNKGLIAKLRCIHTRLLMIESAVTNSSEFGELPVREVEALREAVSRCLHHVHSALIVAGAGEVTSVKVKGDVSE